MKKLLFFLIGFCLVFVPVHMAYASLPTFNDSCLLQKWQAGWHSARGTDYTFNAVTIVPHNTTDAEFNDIMLAIPGTTITNYTYLYDYFHSDCTSTGLSYTSNRVYARRTGVVGNYYMHVIIRPSVEHAGLTPLDSDGDGLPDDCDLYPDDPTPASFRLMTTLYEDSTGNIVGNIIQTDRGDYKEYGDLSNYETSGYSTEYHGNTSSWQSNDDLCGPSGISSGSSPTGDETLDTILEDSINESIGTTDPGTGSATGTDNTATAATGTETDTQALQDIKQNTYSTSQNIKRLADYLDGINKKLYDQNKHTFQTSPLTLADVQKAINNSNLGSGTISAGGGLTSSETTQAVDAALTPSIEDETQATVNAGDVNTEYTTAETTITGNASLSEDAPLEFQEKTDITTKMSDYISGNPISDIINNSGLVISGSTPTATWNYKGQSMVLTVSGFDAQLEAFGQILLGIFTLAGMLLIFRG